MPPFSTTTIMNFSCFSNIYWKLKTINFVPKDAIFWLFAALIDSGAAPFEKGQFCIHVSCLVKEHNLTWSLKFPTETQEHDYACGFLCNCYKGDLYN